MMRKLILLIALINLYPILSLADIPVIDVEINSPYVNDLINNNSEEYLEMLQEIEMLNDEGSQFEAIMVVANVLTLFTIHLANAPRKALIKEIREVEKHKKFSLDKSKELNREFLSYAGTYPVYNNCGSVLRIEFNPKDGELVNIRFSRCSLRRSKIDSQVFNLTEKKKTTSARIRFSFKENESDNYEN
jgi:hypothetical protein